MVKIKKKSGEGKWIPRSKSRGNGGELCVEFEEITWGGSKVLGDGEKSAISARLLTTKTLSDRGQFDRRVIEVGQQKKTRRIGKTSIGRRDRNGSEQRT